MSCDAILSWNLLLLRRASESFSKIIHYSVCSQQVSSKKYFCSNCYSNLPVKSVETEKSCKPTCLGPRHICVTCDIPKALVPVDTSKKDPSDINIQRNLLYKIVNMKKMFSLYWSAAIRKVTMCTKVPSEPTQIGVNKFVGIDMTPVRPKRKENPSPLEIPEPSVPGENLPGFPIPGFPDVAIPIVPELPVPDMPEIPAPTPQVPGKPKPKGKPLPGHPVPILQDTLRERWPLPFIRDLIRQRFPIPAFQDSPVTLISPFIQSPLERNKIVQNIMRSNIRYLSTPNQNSNGKIEISKGLIIPPMVQDLLKKDNIYVPKDEIICTLSKLSPAEIQATYDLIKKHKQKIKDTQEIANDFIFGMTYEQFQQLLTVVAISKKHEKPSQLLGNKLYIPSQLFINNAKFLVPVKKQEYFKDSAIIYDLKQRTYRKIAKLPDPVQSPAACVHENSVYVIGHKHIYRYEDNGDHDRWLRVIETDMTPKFLVSFKGYIYVSQCYFPNLYRFRPNMDKVLEQVACFSHSPMAICNLGNRLLAVTSSGDSSTDIMTVEEYPSPTSDRSTKVLWSMTGSEYGVNPAGACSVVMTIPPVNPDVSTYHERYLTMYG